MQHKKPRKFIFFFFIFMASLLSLLFMALFLSHAAPHHIRIAPNPNPPPTLSNPSPEVRRACKATRFAELCEKSLLLSDLENQPKPVDIIFAAINVSSKNLETAQSMVRVILDTAGSDKNRSGAARNCLEVLSFSQYRIGLSTSALPRGKNKDARAWMSAALLYQYDCWSALKYVNTTQRVNESMAFLNELTELTSNALAMLVSFDLYGEELDKWGPVRTERNGFWEDGGPSSGSGSGSELGFPAGVTADVTVCKAGCDYQTIQAAVDAAPGNLRDIGRRFVIRIKEGVYEEIVRVPLDKRNVVFLGDGMGKTVITGNLNAQMVGISTYNTATVGVAGDGFMARDLTFENTAGPDAHQAVAFRSTADYSILENCEFLGHQDTLYAHSLRQFYKACRIVGTVDFIFGNSASFFKNCLILICPRQLKPEKGSTNCVTAHGRTDPAQWTGFAFANCTINGTDEYLKFYSKNPKAYKNYLGRPWKEYSRTVFIRCYLESIIRPEGWLPWTGDFALSTLYYGEFENTGPGGNISGRVPWSNQIPAEHVSMYSVQNFIQGDEWTPSSQN